MPKPICTSKFTSKKDKNGFALVSVLVKLLKKSLIFEKYFTSKNLFFWPRWSKEEKFLLVRKKQCFFLLDGVLVKNRTFFKFLVLLALFPVWVPVWVLFSLVK